MRPDTKDMQTSSASVKGHQMTVTQLDAYLATRQMHCSCGYAGMVRRNAKDAHGDIARHAYTVRRDALTRSILQDLSRGDELDGEGYPL
jgi:hypothetical protein